MLHKCANSSCTIAFRSLSHGKLFQIESQTTPGPTEQVAPGRIRPRRIDRYWLCERCSASLTLTLGARGAIEAVPLPARRPSPLTPAHA
jgi:hypothetical protein